MLAIFFNCQQSNSKKNPHQAGERAAAVASDEDICGGKQAGVSEQMTKLNYLTKMGKHTIVHN